MSSPKAMLDAIQKAGAAVFDADVQLKLAVKAYGDRVHAAVGLNPYHLGNDALFENWKLVARLSQTMTGMEEELRKVYQVTAELSDDEPSSATVMSALPAPGLVSPPAVVSRSDSNDALAATDVKIKKSKAVTIRKPAATLGKQASPKEAVLPKNAAILLKNLGALLNAKKFTEINQTKLAQAIGIPLGSMTASLKRLVAAGHVAAGPNGHYKLVR